MTGCWLRACAATRVAWLAWALVGCRVPNADDMQLLVRAEWKTDPGTTAEIGTWVSADVGWMSRAATCSPQSPNLRVTIADREARRVPFTLGDCVWDALFEAGPFASDDPGPIVVRVLDGTEVLGEATYEGLFPGPATRLLRPADGVVHLGETFAVALEPPLPAHMRLFSNARYVWLEPSDSVPPFYSYAPVVLEADGQTMTVDASVLTGKAAVTVDTFTQSLSATPSVAATSCAGFGACAGLPSTTLGPVVVDVVP